MKIFHFTLGAASVQGRDGRLDIVRIAGTTVLPDKRENFLQILVACLLVSICQRVTEIDHYPLKNQLVSHLLRLTQKVIVLLHIGFFPLFKRRHKKCSSSKSIIEKPNRTMYSADLLR